MVELKILEKTERFLEVKVVGEGHTLLNLLVDEINKDDRVKYAAYSIDHPLLGEARLVVLTEGSVAPLEAILDAKDRVKKMLELLEKSFSEEVGAAEA